MNTFLLLKVKEAIQANPGAFDMDLWDCGTAACIAGWACRVGGEKISEEYKDAKHLKTAMKLLKIGIEEADRLFLVCAWPEEFRYEYRTARTDKDFVQAAVKRIDHFIQTEGRE